VTVIFGISSSAGIVWEDEITAAVGTIRLKFPSAQTIYLQPVTGGPDEVECFLPDGRSVRASRNHPVIDAAIANVSPGLSGVFAGVSPELSDCSGYRDRLGHLTPEAQVEMATVLNWAYGGWEHVEQTR
jgi:hypothetical protein